MPRREGTCLEPRNSYTVDAHNGRAFSSYRGTWSMERTFRSSHGGCNRFAAAGHYLNEASYAPLYETDMS